MNRCLSLPHRIPRRRFISGCACAALAVCPLGSALAQDVTPLPRNFPEHVKSASMVIVNWPNIRINATPDRLSPGARIYDTHNLIVSPTSLGNLPFWVNYVRESHGMVHEVWILTPQEAALAQAAPKSVW